MAFQEINLEDLYFDTFNKIEDWALLTVGTPDDFNMLTITGFMSGKLFLRNMIQVYVHPDRYSYKFMEKNNRFTVSFFSEPKHPALQLCGTKSGRDCDKAEAAGLTPVDYKGAVLFEQAETVFVCRKVLHVDVQEDIFDDKEVFRSYYRESGRYHRIYVGEVEAVLQ